MWRGSTWGPQKPEKARKTVKTDARPSLAEEPGPFRRLRPDEPAGGRGAQPPFYRELAELTRSFVGAEAAALRS